MAARPAGRDERVANALTTLAQPIEAFRSSLATTVEQVRGMIASRGPVDRAEAASARLGPFGAGYIDAARFADLGADHSRTARRTLEPVAANIDAAFATLAELAAAKDDLFTVTVPDGGRLDDAVGAAYSWIGRAFGAARLTDGADDDPSSLEAYPFTRWTAGERRLAPPLVVRVRGADLHAAQLAPFLDGAAKVVLVVDGACPPAPLARLITPELIVMQTGDLAELARFAAHAGAGIAALVPADAAHFVHDPAAGQSLSERIEVTHEPTDAPREMLAGLSPSQQLQELAQLRALATVPPPPVAPAPPDPSADPAAARAAPAAAESVDQLAAWLLQHADFSDLR